jgi:hypothetical protein
MQRDDGDRRRQNPKGWSRGREVRNVPDELGGSPPALGETMNFADRVRSKVAGELCRLRQQNPILRRSQRRRSQLCLCFRGTRQPTA